MTKAMASKLAHQASLVAREVMGGNGILLENRAIKNLADAQTCLTGEGTYEMNVLVAGKEMTGLGAYK